MRAPLLIASLAGLLIFVGIGFVITRKTCADFHEGEITVGEKHLQVSIAVTREEKVHGLSGCASLPENSGMLFPYNPPEQVAFWMRDMLMPLDIIWIQGSKVVGIERNVPAPAPGTLDQNLLQYKSAGFVDAVLEIKSGGAQEYGIDKGDSVL